MALSGDKSTANGLYTTRGEQGRGNSKSCTKDVVKTPPWKRAELLHKAAAIPKEQKAAVTEALTKKIAKPAEDAITEVVRSGFLLC